MVCAGRSGLLGSSGGGLRGSGLGLDDGLGSLGGLLGGLGSGEQLGHRPRHHAGGYLV